MLKLIQKMIRKSQKQDAGDNSTNLQSEIATINTTNNYGITYSDAKEIALDVFNSNFPRLRAEAAATAKERAENITEKFLSKLNEKNPKAIEELAQPAMQDALFTVQKQYAKSGDNELGDLLVDILVDRAAEQHRNMLQIVLDESLSVAPKLTEIHLAALSVIFIFKYTQCFVGNHQLLGGYFDKHLLPFVSKLSKNQVCYQHLEFSGCGSVGFAGNSLLNILGNTYQGLFLNGFDKLEMANQNINIDLYSKFIIPCLNDQAKLQVNARNKEALEKELALEAVSLEDRDKLIKLYDLNKMSESQVKEKLISIRPYMAEVFEKWTNSPMTSFTLTSVGMAIGHANIKRLVGEFANLAIWINDE